MLSILFENDILLIQDDDNIMSVIHDEIQDKYIFIIKEELNQQEINNIIFSGYSEKKVVFNDLTFKTDDIIIGKKYWGPDNKDQIEGNLLIFNVL